MPLPPQGWFQPIQGSSVGQPFQRVKAHGDPAVLSVKPYGSHLNQSRELCIFYLSLISQQNVDMIFQGSCQRVNHFFIKVYHAYSVIWWF